MPSHLASLKLRDIRHGHVQASIDDLAAADRGAVTIRRIVAVIQGALSSAVRDEILDDSPARHLELPRSTPRSSSHGRPTRLGTSSTSEASTASACSSRLRSSPAFGVPSSATSTGPTSTSSAANFASAGNTTKT